MQRMIMRLGLPVVALFSASASMAASVWVTASPGPSAIPGLYNVGNTFTLTITADIPNTFAGTMDLSFDPTKVAFLQANTGVLSGAGGTSVGTGPWLLIKNSAANVTPTVLNVEQPNSTGPNPGVYQIATLVFTVLAEGSANIVLSDDGGITSGWFDDTTFEYIPLSGGYNNINANLPCLALGPECEPPPPPLPDMPVPAAVWLFGSALGVMGWMRRKAAT